MTNDLIGKISYKNKKVCVKVTYKVECDSTSGEITYGNLIDVKPIDNEENTSHNKVTQSLVQEFISAGNSLKKKNRFNH